MVLYIVSVTFWMLYIVAAFVIAYLILQFLIGKPMYFMELVMGQFSGKGPTSVWNMNPSAKGKARMPHCIAYNDYRCGQCIEVTVNISILILMFSFFHQQKVRTINDVCVSGIGISMMLISLVVAIYYNVIMAYTLFYFFSSMQATLPWTECKPVSESPYYI